jgi:hypothetical protein
VKVTFVPHREPFAELPRAFTVEMDAVPRRGDTVVIDDDRLQGEVYAVIWTITSNGAAQDQGVDVRLR